MSPLRGVLKPQHGLCVVSISRLFVVLFIAVSAVGFCVVGVVRG